MFVYLSIALIVPLHTREQNYCMGPQKLQLFTKVKPKVGPDIKKLSNNAYVVACEHKTNWGQAILSYFVTSDEGVVLYSISKYKTLANEQTWLGAPHKELKTTDTTFTQLNWDMALDVYKKLTLFTKLAPTLPFEDLAQMYEYRRIAQGNTAIYLTREGILSADVKKSIAENQTNMSAPVQQIVSLGSSDYARFFATAAHKNATVQEADIFRTLGPSLKFIWVPFSKIKEYEATTPNVKFEIAEDTTTATVKLNNVSNTELPSKTAMSAFLKFDSKLDFPSSVQIDIKSIEQPNQSFKEWYTSEYLRSVLAIAKNGTPILEENAALSSSNVSIYRIPLVNGKIARISAIADSTGVPDSIKIETFNRNVPLTAISP